MPKDTWQRILLLMVLVFSVSALSLLTSPPVEQEPVALIAYSHFKNELKQDRIAEVTLQEKDLPGFFLNHSPSLPKMLLVYNSKGSVPTNSSAPTSHRSATRD